jgi:hypothetical protein
VPAAIAVREGAQQVILRRRHALAGFEALTSAEFLQRASARAHEFTRAPIRGFFHFLLVASEPALERGINRWPIGGNIAAFFPCIQGIKTSATAFLNGPFTLEG